MSSPIRQCSQKGKAIASDSESKSTSSPLIRRPRAITLGGMDNPRPTTADLASLDDNERDIVRFSREMEDRETTGHTPADDMEQENELLPEQPISADADSVNKDKTSTEKEVNFALADFLPMRWTETDLEFDEEIDQEQERTLSTKKKQNWANHFPTNSTFKTRLWTPPSGYACVYESWFVNSSLWWSLLEFLTTYCSRRKIALGQYTANGIRILVTLTVLAAELGIRMSVRLFEELTTPSITAKTGFFYGKMVPKYNVITGKTSKVNFWNHRYFYVKSNEASFEDPTIILNVYFNSNIGGSQSFLEEVEAIRTLSHQHWPYISEARIQAALNRINRAEVPTEIPVRHRHLKMGKLNLSALSSYADTIGTPEHGRGSTDVSRPTKRRRDSSTRVESSHVSPIRSPPLEKSEEHLGGDQGGQNLTLEENPPTDPVSEAGIITATEMPMEEHPVDPPLETGLQGDKHQGPALASHDNEVEYPHVIDFKYRSIDVPFIEDHEAPTRLFCQIKLKKRGMPE
ncbi:hypothetical protein N665_0193s0016 [Sinapis alba]|nr:hypothetical protein N665_0193s0016 [Sinapis alba]